MGWLSKVDRALSVREKVMLVATIVLLVVIGAIAFVAIKDERAQMRSQYLERGAAMTRIMRASLAPMVLAGEQAAAQQSVARIVADEPTLLGAKVYLMQEGHLLVWASSEPSLVGDSAEEEHGEDVETKPHLHEERCGSSICLESLAPITSPDSSVMAWLGLYFSLEPLDAATASLRNRFILVGLIGFGVLLGAIFVIVRQFVLRHVRKLADATERVASGDLNVRVDTQRRERPTRDELVVLTHGFNDMVQSIQNLYDETQRLSVTDPLTGVHNRRYLDSSIEGEMQRAERLGYNFAVAMLDLDHFKAINDRYGHKVGDAVLRRVAQVMKSAVRETDTVVRYGGEEFVTVHPGCGKDGAPVIAEKLRRAVADAFADTAQEGNGLTVSVGIAVYGGAGETADELLGRADEAMYLAKVGGRNLSIVAPAPKLATPMTTASN